MIRFAVNLIFIISLVCSSHLYSQENDSTPEELKQADQFIEAGKNDEALVILRNYVFSNPSNIEAQEKKISVLLKLDKEKEAYKDIDDLQKMYPTSPEYYYLRAVLNFQKEKYVKSIDDFDKAIELKMPKAYIYKVYLNRGMAHFNLQDFDLAESDFNAVIADDPKNGAAYHGLGMVKYEQHEYEEAVKAFQKSLSFDEKNAITHFNMAMSYFRLDQKDNACYHFNRSCALGNRNACKLVMMECAQKLNLSK
jgi:tetratricopeptide (TPR) repeat protein